MASSQSRECVSLDNAEVAERLSRLHFLFLTFPTTSSARERQHSGGDHR